MSSSEHRQRPVAAGGSPEELSDYEWYGDFTGVKDFGGSLP